MKNVHQIKSFCLQTLRYIWLTIIPQEFVTKQIVSNILFFTFFQFDSHVLLGTQNNTIFQIYVF